MSKLTVTFSKLGEGRIQDSQVFTIFGCSLQLNIQVIESASPTDEQMSEDENESGKKC